MLSCLTDTSCWSSYSLDVTEVWSKYFLHVASVDFGKWPPPSRHCHWYWWVLMLRKICPRGNVHYLSAKGKETSRFIDLSRICLFACLSYLLIQSNHILYWRVWLFPVRLKLVCMLEIKKRKLSIYARSPFSPRPLEKRLFNSKDDIQNSKYGLCAWAYTYTCICGTCIEICFSILSIIWLKFSIVLYRYSLFSLATIACTVNEVCVCLCDFFDPYLYH